jgi:hypothetical protein
MINVADGWTPQGISALILAMSSFLSGTTTGIIALRRAWKSDSKANDLAEDMQTVAKAVPSVHEENLNSKEIVNGNSQ